MSPSKLTDTKHAMKQRLMAYSELSSFSLFRTLTPSSSISSLQSPSDSINDFNSHFDSPSVQVTTSKDSILLPEEGRPKVNNSFSYAQNIADRSTSLNFDAKVTVELTRLSLLFDDHQKKAAETTSTDICSVAEVALVLPPEADFSNPLTASSSYRQRSDSAQISRVKSVSVSASQSASVLLRKARPRVGTASAVMQTPLGSFARTRASTVPDDIDSNIYLISPAKVAHSGDTFKMKSLPSLNIAYSSTPVKSPLKQASRLSAITAKSGQRPSYHLSSDTASLTSSPSQYRKGIPQSQIIADFGETHRAQTARIDRFQLHKIDRSDTSARFAETTPDLVSAASTTSHYKFYKNLQDYDNAVNKSSDNIGITFESHLVNKSNNAI